MAKDSTQIIEDTLADILPIWYCKAQGHPVSALCRLQTSEALSASQEVINETLNAKNFKFFETKNVRKK